MLLKHAIKKMRNLLCVLAMIFTVSLHAADDEQVDVGQIFKRLDATIDSIDVFEAKKQENMAFLRSQMQKAGTDAMRYQMAYALFKEYESYDCDSALVYLQRCSTLSMRMNRSDLLAQCSLDKAVVLAKTGFYAEAQTYFASVPRSELHGEKLATYYWGMGYMNGEMAFYCKDEPLKTTYQQRQQLYTDSLLTVVDNNSWQFLSVQITLLYRKGRLDDAMACTDRWMASIKPYSRDYAIVAYFRSEIYKKMGKQTMQWKWLTEAAITDIRHSVMDQAALLSLANSLCLNGKTDRAYRYMEFSWKCINKYSPHMRSWILTPILNLVKDQREEQLSRNNSRLFMLSGAVTILMLVMAMLYYMVMRKRRQLAKVRDELRQSNDSLEKLNAELQDVNNKLTTANLHLHDSNRIKEQGMGQFLRLCSQQVDNLNDFRIMVNRKLRVNQYAELVRLTDSEQLKETEMEALFHRFDEIFLQIFPTFINDFNELLTPDARITPPQPGELTTILRIFALIRMGIDDGADIADFLRCSPASVYSYRSRIRRSALCDRNEFEQKVKEIGISV